MGSMPGIRAFCFVVALATAGAIAEEARYSDEVARYLQRINREGQGNARFRVDYPGGHAAWENDARASLSLLLGLEKIAAQAPAFTPSVQLGEMEVHEGYTRQRGEIETEPDVRVPFWLLRPLGTGPFPLAIFPHGHDAVGMDSHVGLAHDEAHAKRIATQDRDVAVQAVRRGFIAIAPATRGLAGEGIPDLQGRHGKRGCRSHLMHALLAGRTAMGERVWDMSRLIDWASTRPDMDMSQVLMMGNSGGGMVTLYAAACDTRITIAVSSCAFTQVIRGDGYIYHCDCNMVPGLLAWGDLPDVAGLIAPRHFLAVSGRGDSLHSEQDIETAARRAKEIFSTRGVEDRFAHQWGDDGHRYYKRLMWPFVEGVLHRP